MRLFVASPLSPANRAETSPMLTALVDEAQGLLRPVAAGSEHLTHVFLGEREARLPEVLAALEPIRRLPSFRVRVGGARVFMGRGTPRLLCLDVLEGADDVAGLAERTRKALEELFPDLAYYRTKKPHITLARFSRRARRLDGRRVEEALASGRLGAWQKENVVEQVEIVRSVLTPTGARYETVGSVSLGSP